MNLPLILITHAFHFLSLLKLWDWLAEICYAGFARPLVTNVSQFKISTTELYMSHNDGWVFSVFVSINTYALIHAACSAFVESYLFMTPTIYVLGKNTYCQRFCILNSDALYYLSRTGLILPVQEPVFFPWTKILPVKNLFEVLFLSTIFC